MKSLVVLIVCVAVFGAIAVVRHQDAIFGRGPRAPVSPDAGQRPALPALDPARVASITIQDGAGTRRLIRTADGWVVEDRFGAPAKPESVTQSLDSVAGLAQATLVGQSPARHAEFDLTESTAKSVRFEAESGEVLLNLLIGRADLSRGTAQRGTFVREAGKDAVFLHGKPLTTLFRSDHRAWLDLRLSPKDQGEVVKLVDAARRIILEYTDENLGTDEEPAAAARTGEKVRIVLESEKVPLAPPGEEILPRPPTPSGKDYEIRWRIVEPDSAKDIECYTPMVEPLVRQLLGGIFDDVKARDCSDPALGLGEPALELTVTFEDGSSRSLKVGALIPTEGETMPGARFRYAQVAGNPFALSVSVWTARMFQKKPADFRNPASAPGEAAPASPTGEIVVPPDPPGEK
jgi:hypothetical protein